MASCQDWRYNYFYMTLNAWISYTGTNYHNVSWELILHTSRLNVASSDYSVNIDGQVTNFSVGAMEYGSGSHDVTLGSGTNTIWHTDAKTIDFSFSTPINWNISGTHLGGMSASGELDLPQLAKSPTLPNSVVCSGKNDTWWIDVTNPVFNVEWSGADSGTYTISQYSIDASKDNWGNSYNVDNVSTSATSGSRTNVSLSSLSLTGGETIKIRVGLKTSNGTWWGHTYWGGTFTAFSYPTAPTTFVVPSSQEIDTKFNVTWSGATAGSNGIAGYDLETRAYNGSSWTDWVRLYDCANATSYNFGTPKSLTVNGVSYATAGENIKFQYRIRTSDGKIATSAWVTKEMGIKINSPSTPRK